MPYSRSSYPLVSMPAPPNPTQSLGDLLQMAAGLQSRRQSQRREDRLDQAASSTLSDKRALDRAFSPQAAMADAMGTSDWQGPTDPTAPPPPRSREAILSSVPGHLRPVVLKQFDEEDENGRKATMSILAVAKAQRDAIADVNDHLAGLAYTAAQWGFDPTATGVILDRGRQRYASNPEMLNQIEHVAAQIKADPARIKPLAEGLIGQSTRYAELYRKTEGTSEIQLAITAATDPDPDVAAAAQRTLDTFAAYKVASTTKPVREPAGSDYAQELTRRETDMGRPMTSRERLAFRATWEATGRRPEVDAATRAATLAQKATAERDKQDRLFRFEAEVSRRQGGFDIIGEPTPGGLFDEKGHRTRPMSEEEIARRKAEIQQSYLAQIGISASSPHAPTQPAAALEDRARRILQQAGKASDAAAIARFLQNNPEFR